MKTTLKSLEMKGLRSFVEPATVTFPEKGLVLLMGPSGSGKSSIFMAVSHALGFCPYSATDLQSWLGDEKLEVRLGLGTSEGDVTVVRGTKSFIDGAVKIQGAANVTPTITKLTGLNSDLLSALTYRPQGTSGLFLSKTNSEMQEFLSTLLGLDKFDLAVEKTEAKISSLKTDCDATNAKLATVRERMSTVLAKQPWPIRDEAEFVKVAANLETDRDSTAAAIKEATKVLAEMVSNWDSLAADFARRRNEEQSKHPRPKELTTNNEIERLKTLKSQAYERVGKLQEQDKGRINGVKSEIRALQEELVTYTSQAQREEEWQKEMGKKEDERLTLKNAKCPRCEQDWRNEAVARDIEATEKRISDLFSLIHAAKQSKNMADEVRKAISKKQEELQPNPKIDQMVEIFKDATNELTAELGKLKLENSTRLNEWQNEIQTAVYDIKEEEAQALRLFNAAKDAQNRILARLAQELTERTVTWKDAAARVQSVKSENEYARKDNERMANECKEVYEVFKSATIVAEEALSNLRIEQDLLELLKAFLTAIYDEVLEEIAYSTNQMLAEIPNVAHVTIKFKSERTTQKGNTKRAIVPVVNINGGERPLRSALSGGMMTAVELAVDLAVRRVISARSGAIPGWLILDECFEGLPIAEKEACLELLKRASEDTLILVIDHSSETKELFSQVIEVENANGRSSIAA